MSFGKSLVGNHLRESGAGPPETVENHRGPLETVQDMASLTDLGRKSIGFVMRAEKKKIPTCWRHLGEDSGPLASGHSLYAMVGENPRSIDDSNSILAHSECRGPTREAQARPGGHQGRCKSGTPNPGKVSF